MQACACACKRKRMVCIFVVRERSRVHVFACIACVCRRAVIDVASPIATPDSIVSLCQSTQTTAPPSGRAGTRSESQLFCTHQCTDCTRYPTNTDELTNLVRRRGRSLDSGHAPKTEPAHHIRLMRNGQNMQCI